MLRIGLTGGIGAGKSTVAGRLVELGAVLVDSDAVAREVVRPGSPGLAQVVEAFGAEVLTGTGELDRPKLGSIVFADPEARRRLNGILHPLIGRRTAELVAAAPPDGIVVQDVPLLVEGGMAPAFPLVVVVHADAEERVRRLVADRGMTAEDARARIAAQADDAARRAAADVWLDNSGDPAAVRDQVDRLWRERLVPFEENLRLERPPGRPRRFVAPDPEWPARFARLAARVASAAGAAARVDPVGPTAVPGLPAPDVLDIQLAVPAGGAVDPAGMRAAGFLPRGDGYVSADPGRPAEVAVRPLGSPEYREALRVRDWLRADPDARADYLTAARRAAEPGGAPSEPPPAWWEQVAARAERWAAITGWRTPESLSAQPS